MKFTRMAPLGAGMALLLLAGCTAAPPETSTEVPSVTLLNSWAGNPFWQACGVAAERVASEAGASLTQLDGNNSAQTQVDQIDTTIQRAPDAILIAANDSSAVVPQLQQAIDEGIRVYAFNTAVPNLKLDATVAMDEVATGAAAADELVRLAQEAGKSEINLVHLVGDVATEPVQLRRAGFNDQIVKPVEGLTINMVEVVTSWNPDQAVTGLTDALTKGPVDAIFAESDFLTPFLVPALERSGYTTVDGDNHVIIVGLGGTEEGLQAIREGWQDASFNYQIDGMCNAAMRIAIAQQGGSEVEDVWEEAVAAAGLESASPRFVPDETAGPSILLTANLVTADNVDDSGLWANNYND